MSLLYTVLVLAPLILCAVSLLVISVRFAAREPGERERAGEPLRRTVLAPAPSEDTLGDLRHTRWRAALVRALDSRTEVITRRVGFSRPRADPSGSLRGPQNEPLPAGVATKGCPDCAETVLAAARVCKHCRYRFDAEPGALAA